MGFIFLYGFPELLLLTHSLAGGYLSSSLAIATDAAHLLTDFASFMISLFALWVGSRPATRIMSFGWHRAEVLGALTSVLLIWVVTGILVYLAVQRVITRDFEIESTSMLITSGVGLVVNLVWVLEYSLSKKFYNETYWWWKEVLKVWNVWSLKCTKVMFKSNFLSHTFIQSPIMSFLWESYKMHKYTLWTKCWFITF